MAESNRSTEQSCGKCDGRTHAEDCWNWGRNHYDCAIAELERLQAEVARLRKYDPAERYELLGPIRGGSSV